MQPPDSLPQNQDKQIVIARGEDINFADLKPMNDPACQHIWMREEEEDIPGTYTEVCRKCIVGRIVRK